MFIIGMFENEKTFNHCISQFLQKFSIKYFASYIVDAHEVTLDVLSDVLADFLRKLSKLMRVAMDAEASQRESRFPVCYQ